MGFFDSKSSKTTVNNQDENILNNAGDGVILNISDVNLDGGNIGTASAKNGGVATAGDGGGAPVNSGGINVNYTQSDFGAVQSSFGFASDALKQINAYAQSANDAAGQKFDLAADLVKSSQPAQENTNNLLKLLALALVLGSVVIVVKRGR